AIAAGGTATGACRGRTVPTRRAAGRGGTGTGAGTRTGRYAAVLGAPVPHPAARQDPAMSASTAIGMVSASLRNLLVGEMHLSPAPDVTVLAPDEPGSNRRVNLFLYKLVENPYLKNQDFTVAPGTPNRLIPPPLSLSLFYLLTPYAPNDPLTGNATAHQILGEAMRAFYQTPPLPPTHPHP